MSTSKQTTGGEHPGWGDGWGVDLRVWVERAGQTILGPGRLELLEGIARHHSISAAARHIGMSYRHAWQMVQEINQAAGEPLVIASTGGVKGGGAQLSPLGSWAVSIFRELNEQCRQMAAGLLPRLRKHSPRTALHVAAAVSLEEVFGQILADFVVHEPTVRVRAVFGASDELADHLLAGAPADLFLSADLRQLDRLQAAKLVHGEQRVLLAENGLAVIGLANRSLVVRKPSDLAGNTALRIALAEPDCPLGSYTRAYLKGLHLYTHLRGRALLVENSRGVIGAIRAGQADVGLAYSSDAARADGCQVLFRVRTRAVPISYGAAILNRGQDLAAAHALLAFLTSSPSTRRFRDCGFLAVQNRG
jgi:molybdenum ABC transporter molybdate-binding protein